jgi:hypothetical protein
LRWLDLEIFDKFLKALKKFLKSSENFKSGQPILP